MRTTAATPFFTGVRGPKCLYSRVRFSCTRKPLPLCGTHQALVADPSGRLHKCFVKASPLGNPMVLTESVAWMIAGAVDLPRPEFAAVLLLPV